jgi:hypothetical protein
MEQIVPVPGRCLQGTVSSLRVASMIRMYAVARVSRIVGGCLFFFCLWFFEPYVSGSD